MKYTCGLILLSFLLMGRLVSAQSKADSVNIWQKVALLPDSSKLIFWDSLAYSNIRSNVYRGYALELLKEAGKQRNLHYEANAYFLLIRSYYKRIPDSMRYYIEKAEPVFLQENRLEDLFRVKAWNVYSLTSEGRHNDALAAVTKLKNQAHQFNYPDGNDMANQALADFYISTNLNSEGEALYEEILQNMEERKAPLIKRINIIRQLMNLHSNSEKRLDYLHLLDKYLQECDAQGITQLDNEDQIPYLKYALHRNYTTEYLNMGDIEQARIHLQTVDKLVNEYNLKSVNMECTSLKGAYYYALKQYDKSLEYYDIVEKNRRTNKRNNDLLNVLNIKSHVLYDAGRTDEATKTCWEYISLSDSISKADFYAKLADLGTQHEITKLELEKQKMKTEANRNHTRMLFFLFGFFVLLLICIMSGYLVYVIHRDRKSLRKAKEKAEEADRLKSVFLANMNHEIRTPLNAIVGFSDLLVEEEDIDTKKEYGEIIRRNNDLLQRLISDVLDLSKLESDMISFSYTQVDLPSFMKELEQTVGLRMPDGVKLRLTPCQDFIFTTDQNRLMQILLNLITNAIKHTSKGFICMGYDVDENQICFFVEDTGEGIPEEKLENIFSRFVQLDDWHTGVGLGLAISKGLIVKMGGSIQVSSEVGKGSIFRVFFPLDGGQTKK